MKPDSEFSLNGYNGNFKNRCKECLRQYSKEWRINNRDYALAYDRQTKYGLSETEFQTLFLIQCGKCAICSELLIKPHIDHDHETGRVRGLLCESCNWGIGHLKDSLDILSNAVSYLKE